MNGERDELIVRVYVLHFLIIPEIYRQPLKSAHTIEFNLLCRDLLCRFNLQYFHNNGEIISLINIGKFYGILIY